MTAYNVPTGHIGKYGIALAANIEDTVTFGADQPSAYDLGRVEVLVQSGTEPVYFRFGPTGAATVQGTDCYIAMPGTAVVVEPPTSGDTVVRLICAAVAVVSVARG